MEDDAFHVRNGRVFPDFLNDFSEEIPRFLADDFANEVVIEDVSENISIMNEVVISEETADVANVIEVEEMPRFFAETNSMHGDSVDSVHEAVRIENHANEVVITDVTENISSMNEVVVSGETAEVTNVIEVVTDEATLENEVESSVCREEIESPPEKKICVKMKHFLSFERYLYVLELVEAVEEYQNKDTEKSPQRNRLKIDRPIPCTFYFTDMHKYYMLKYISFQEKDFISVINESIPSDNICTFEICKERFIERYKPKTFTAIGFIRICAAIAYLGVHCSSRRLDPSAKSKAINYICSLLYDVVQRNLLKELTEI